MHSPQYDDQLDWLGDMIRSDYIDKPHAFTSNDTWCFLNRNMLQNHYLPEETKSLLIHCNLPDTSS